MAESPKDSNSDNSEKEDYEDSEYKDRIAETSPKGRFIRFNEELGFGAYKTVYRAYDNDSGCEVAWNVIKLQRLPPNERKRISEEISLLKNLHHPNIINFINAWINKSKNEVVFITECACGGSLKKDIKCENVFINTTNNEIRIGDLGLAVSLKNSSHTTSVIGTPEFMAPEIYEEKYGTPVDIYSFGMCVLEMATLSTPYRECTSAAQVYKKVSQGILPYQIDLIQNEGLKQLILKCVSHYKDRPSALELLNDKFLDISEQEEDNYPVQLLEVNNLSIQQINTLTNGSPLDALSLSLIKNQKLKESSPAQKIIKAEEYSNEETFSEFQKPQTGTLSNASANNQSHKKRKNQLTIDIIEYDNDEIIQQQQIALKQQQEKLAQQTPIQLQEIQSSQINSTSSQQQQQLQQEILETDSNYKTPQNQKNKSRVINEFESSVISSQNISTNINQINSNNVSLNNNNNNNNSQNQLGQIQISGIQVDLNESTQSTSERINIQKPLQDFKVIRQDQVDIEPPVTKQNSQKDLVKSQQPQQLQQQQNQQQLSHQGNDTINVNNYQANISSSDITCVKNPSTLKSLQEQQANEESQELLMTAETPTLRINANSTLRNSMCQDQSNQQNSSNNHQQIQISDENDQSQSISLESPLNNQSQSSQSSINKGIYLYNINYSLQINEYSQDQQYRYAFTLEVRDSLYPFDIAVDKNIINNNEYTREMICNLIKDALSQIECQELEKIHSYIIDDTYVKFQDFQAKKKKMNKKNENLKNNLMSPIKSSTAAVHFNLTPDEKNECYPQHQVGTPARGTIIATQIIQDDLNSHNEIEEGVFYNEDSDDLNRQEDYNQISQNQQNEYTQNQTYYQNNYSRLDSTSHNLRNDNFFQQTPDPNSFHQMHQQSYISAHSVQINNNAQQQHVQKMNIQNQHSQLQQSVSNQQQVQMYSYDSHQQKQYQILPQNIQQVSIFPAPPSLTEKLQNISPQSNFYFNKLIESFILYYKQYWECNYESMIIESQEMMKFRQQKELIELQRLHVVQHDQWLAHQMQLTQNQIEKQEFNGFQLPNKQNNTQQQNNFIIYQCEQGNMIQSNHSVLDISNISNVKEVDNDNHISPQLKDSMDMELSNMLSDNPSSTILGHTNIKQQQQYQQNQQNYQQINMNPNNINFNIGGQLQQLQPEFIISPQNQSIGNQQFIQSMQTGEIISNGKKIPSLNRPSTPNQYVNESVPMKQSSNSSGIYPPQKGQQQGIYPNQVQQLQNYNNALNSSATSNNNQQYFQNGIQNAEKTRQSLQITPTAQIQIPANKSYQSSQSLNQQAPKAYNNKQPNEKVIQQNNQQQQQQAQQQITQQQQPQQQQVQQQTKMNSKPPTPKQVVQTVHNPSTLNNLTPSNQGAQQPLKPIKLGGQSMKQNFIGTHSAASSQDSSYFSFQFMNEGSNQQQGNQQPAILHPQTKSSQNIKQYFHKSQTPQHMSHNEQAQNTAQKMSLTSVQSNGIQINSSLNNQSGLLNQQSRDSNQIPPQYQKLETSEICQLQKPLTKLTKKTSTLLKQLTNLNSNQDLGQQDIAQLNYDKKESANKNTNQTNQSQGGILLQLNQSESKDWVPPIQLQQQQGYTPQNQQNHQSQGIQQAQQVQIGNNQANYNHLFLHHQNSHHHHSVIVQRQNQIQCSLPVQGHHTNNQSLDITQRGNHKNNSNVINQNISTISQQSSNSLQIDASPISYQAFHSFNPIQNQQEEQQQQQQQQLLQQQQQQQQQLLQQQQQNQIPPIPKKINQLNFENTNTPQFSPAPSKQLPPNILFDDMQPTIIDYNGSRENFTNTFSKISLFNTNQTLNNSDILLPQQYPQQNE